MYCKNTKKNANLLIINVSNYKHGYVSHITDYIESLY